MMYSLREVSGEGDIIIQKSCKAKKKECCELGKGAEDGHAYEANGIVHAEHQDTGGVFSYPVGRDEGERQASQKAFAGPPEGERLNGRSKEPPFNDLDD